jgi:hypothetical protein
MSLWPQGKRGKVYKQAFSPLPVGRGPWLSCSRLVRRNQKKRGVSLPIAEHIEALT